MSAKRPDGDAQTPHLHMGEQCFSPDCAPKAKPKVTTRKLYTGLRGIAGYIVWAIDRGTAPGTILGTVGHDVGGLFSQLLGEPRAEFFSPRTKPYAAHAPAAVKRALPGQEPVATPAAGGVVNLRLTREQADALYLRLGEAQGSLHVPENARTFRIYQALHVYFSEEARHGKR